MAVFTVKENSRLELQQSLDAMKTQEDRNRLGQFATPTQLAGEVLELAKANLPPGTDVRFMDPAFGTGAFYSALCQVFPKSRIHSAVGFEIDGHYHEPASRLWKGTPLELKLADFTRQQFPTQDRDKPNLIVCNPPYVRHHHLAVSEKPRLQRLAFHSSGMELNGLAGLYCYFLGLCHNWLAAEGLALWLIPSEFMDVNYGEPVKKYLLNRVTLLRVHRFNPADAQFGDAIVSSAVLCFRNSTPPENHQIEFSYGGSVLKPRTARMVDAQSVRSGDKWTQIAVDGPAAGVQSSDPVLSDFFTIKRGLATGSNEYFVMPLETAQEFEIPRQFLRPILPSPRYLTAEEIQADSHGNPILDRRLLLLDCNLAEEEVPSRFPGLWRYLLRGKQQGIDQGYLCRHRQPWYSQEEREGAPFLCTYMGRTINGRSAFRFILNHSKATAANVYLLLYPKPPLARAIRKSPELAREVWHALQAITPENLIGVGRVYGGGLHKMEPKELAKASAGNIAALLPEFVPPRQTTLLFS